MDNTLLGLVIKTDGSMFFGQVKKGLSDIYATLGCDCIEAIRLQDAIMYIDEEVNMTPHVLNVEPKMNKIASLVAWSNGLNRQDWIAGDVVIFGTVSPDGENDGENYDVPFIYKNLFERFARLTPNSIDFMVLAAIAKE